MNPVCIARPGDAGVLEVRPQGRRECEIAILRGVFQPRHKRGLLFLWGSGPLSVISLSCITRFCIGLENPISVRMLIGNPN